MEAISTHDLVLRAHLTENHGYEVATEVCYLASTECSRQVDLVCCVHGCHPCASLDAQHSCLRSLMNQMMRTFRCIFVAGCVTACRYEGLLTGILRHNILLPSMPHKLYSLQGDAFVMAFHDSRDAVSWAVSTQQVRGVFVSGMSCRILQDSETAVIVLVL